MTVLTMPSFIKFATCRFGLQANTRTFSSPFDRSTQTLEMAGARWVGTYTLPRLKYAQAREMRAFLTALKGQAGRFFAYDPPYEEIGAAGSLLGTPLVDGGSQTGESLDLKGLNSGETGILLEGDYFSINGELKIVKYGTQLDADSSGRGTVEFIPSLRTSPADNDPIVWTSPRVTMMLASDDEGYWEEEPLFWSFSFSAHEVF